MCVVSGGACCGCVCGVCGLGVVCVCIWDEVCDGCLEGCVHGLCACVGGGGGCCGVSGVMCTCVVCMHVCRGHTPSIAFRHLRGRMS